MKELFICLIFFIIFFFASVMDDHHVKFQIFFLLLFEIDNISPKVFFNFSLVLSLYFHFYYSLKSYFLRVLVLPPILLQNWEIKNMWASHKSYARLILHSLNLQSVYSTKWWGTLIEYLKYIWGLCEILFTYLKISFKFGEIPFKYWENFSNRIREIFLGFKIFFPPNFEKISHKPQKYLRYYIRIHRFV